MAAASTGIPSLDTDSKAISATFLDYPLSNPTSRLTYEHVDVKGTKHVQCFPRCHEGGHRDGVACGEPVKVLATLPPSTDPQKIAAYAEFFQRGRSGEGRYTLGQVVPLAYVPVPGSPSSFV